MCPPPRAKESSAAPEFDNIVISTYAVSRLSNWAIAKVGGFLRNPEVESRSYCKTSVRPKMSF